MKNSTVFLAAIVFAISCNTMPYTKTLEVAVVDKFNKEPVDSAEVNFKTSSPDAMVTETLFTNPKGICVLVFEYDTPANYDIYASKKGYVPFYDFGDNYKMLSRQRITSKTGAKTTLFLTSDTNHLLDFYREITLCFDMDSLIYLLKTNNYPSPGELGYPKGFGLPKILWTDIPKLLEIGNDSTVLTNFPYHFASSYWQEECYLGILALWLVESARISIEKNIVNPAEFYPYGNPALKLRENNFFASKPSQLELMGIAYVAYIAWWENSIALGKEEACKTNPLENGELRW